MQVGIYNTGSQPPIHTQFIIPIISSVKSVFFFFKKIIVFIIHKKENLLKENYFAFVGAC